MIRINQIKLPLGHDRQDMLAKVSSVLGVPAGEIHTLDIMKQSVDARKKPDISYSYSVDVTVRGIAGKKEEKLVNRLRNRNVLVQDGGGYCLPRPGTAGLSHPPVIIGTGPAGLFCGKAGLPPNPPGTGRGRGYQDKAGGWVLGNRKAVP